YAFYGFFALLISFSFWSYGTNGIRNGIATSLFLYGLSKESIRDKAIFFSLAIGCHKSVAIPLGATINMAGASVTITVLSLAAVNTFISCKAEYKIFTVNLTCLGTIFYVIEMVVG
ncbi:MAG: hypothetical protein EOO47_27640, partial [Flavobacterium sp.]